jgi:hypothetical protein
MTTLRSGFLCTAVLILCAALATPAGAQPKAPKLLKLSVHSSVGGTAPIVVRWRTDRALARGQSYKVMLGTNGFPDRDCPACAGPQLERSVGRGVPRGRTIVVRFPLPKEGRWCASRTAFVAVSVNDGRGTIGSASFVIRDHRGLAPTQLFWGRWTFGASSTITVKVSGRPDRSAPITATIDQDTLGPPLAGDTLYTNASGTVTPGALPADPLCTAASPTPLTVDRATTMVIPGARYPQSLPPELTLVLRAGGAALTGCAPDGPAPAVTTVVLTGVGAIMAPGGGFHLAGSLDGVHLAGGGTATIAFDVVFVGGSPPIPD